MSTLWVLSGERWRVEPIRTAKPPILIVGMHRSGTSCLTAMLRRLGLITGWSLNNEESVFFHLLNLEIERATGGRWDDPTPIEQAAADPDLLADLLPRLRRTLRSTWVVLYMGLRRFWCQKSLEELDQPWGWKDPRNTFTFDIWRHLFPGARIIHIYRCGVDVAASLRARERSRVQALSGYASPRCRTLHGAFSLWQEYVDKAFSLSPDGGERDILHVRYEDFLTSPKAVLTRMVEFCELQPCPRVWEKVIAQVNSRRAFAFRRDPELQAFYEEVRGDPRMVRLGYGDL